MKEREREEEKGKGNILTFNSIGFKSFFKAGVGNKND